MPSPHQHAAAAKEYPDEETKILATKNRLTLEALIKGMTDPDRITAYFEAERELAADEDRETRKRLIAALQRRLDTLRES